MSSHPSAAPTDSPAPETPGAPGRRRAGDVGGRVRKVALIGLSLVAVAAFGTKLMADGPEGALMVVATFDDASPLLEGNDVRLNGVKVGQVAAIDLTADGADVVLELQESALPLHRDASAFIRPVSLLGERYVDLDQGTPSQPVIGNGDRISAESTGSTTDLDQVLGVFDDPTSTALAALMTGLGGGMDGNGENVADAIAALTPAWREFGDLGGVLSDQNRTLARLVTSMEAVAGGLATDRGRSLDRLVASAQGLLDTTTTNEAAFRSFLAQLPQTLAAARLTLAQLERTADETTPSLAAMRPTTDDLSAISTELRAFADAADPALADLNPVLERAQQLIREAAPVAELLRQQGDAMRSDVGAFDALTRELAPNFTTVMEFFKGWALATNSRDGLTHYFRAGAVLTPYSATGLLPSTPAADTDAKGPRGPRTPGPPDLPDLPGVPDLEGLVGDVTGGLSGLLSRRTAKDGGVTGLTADQELSALDFLLGGN